MESVSLFDLYQGAGLAEAQEELGSFLVFSPALEALLTDDEANVVFQNSGRGRRDHPLSNPQVIMSQPTDLTSTISPIPTRPARRPKRRRSSLLAKLRTSSIATAQLKEVNVDGVEPTAHAFPIYNVWADDVAVAGLSVEDALRNAPKTRDNMIVVPTVVE